ncbi:MAG: restriction endonuclease, partial [Selenomonadaceae bacterium]|nr:restriction endonuclease [Selenomonadaceae bacterium]
QLYRFVCEAKIGNYVVFPSKVDRAINIGRIEGEYFYEPSEGRFVQQRKMKWLKTAIPRTAFSQGALHEVGSAMTFFQIRSYADEFLSALSGTVNKVVEDDPTIGETAEEIEAQSRDYILKQLKKNYKGYPFEEVVQDLLRAMGYAKTSVSRHGGDHGKDIIVYKDELPPRIVVQVKSQDDPIPEKMLQQLNGCLEGGDYGVFVALSHFTDNALKFLSKTPRIRAIDCEEFIDLFLSYYDKLSDEYQKAIPLRKVYIPVASHEDG